MAVAVVTNPHAAMFAGKPSATNPHLAMLSRKAQQRAAGAPAASSKAASGPQYAPLTRQEMVNKLDSIPVFHLMNEQSQIWPAPNEAGEVAVRWFVDVDEANSALVAVQSFNPNTPLQLGVTPLGTAYALSHGWVPNNAKHPLKLMASKAVVAALSQELGAEADDSTFPLFSCDELSSGRVRPFWTCAEDVRATWLSMGRPEASFPAKLDVTSLEALVALATTLSGLDGRTLMLIASSKATEKAQQLQELEAERERTLQAVGLGDEPPPLEGDEPPPLV